MLFNSVGGRFIQDTTPYCSALILKSSSFTTTLKRRRADGNEVRVRDPQVMVHKGEKVRVMIQMKMMEKVRVKVGLNMVAGI